MQEIEMSKGGRTLIGDKPMTPAELQQRHRVKGRELGHKVVQATIRDSDLVDVLRKLRDRENLRSDTAAVNWVLELALSKLKDKV